MLEKGVLSDRNYQNIQLEARVGLWRYHHQLFLGQLSSTIKAFPHTYFSLKLVLEHEPVNYIRILNFNLWIIRLLKD